MESHDGASCSQNNGNNREDEGVPNQNVNPIILAKGSNDVAAKVSRSETLSTDILGLPSAVAQFLKPETLGTQFILELKESEEGGRSIQIRKQGNKIKMGKITDSNQQVSERCANCELPPSQKVVWLDHILERILKYLDVSNLLQCRLVSHRFKAFAGSLLRNRMQLEFEDLHLHDHKSGKLLSELTALLRDEQIDLPCKNIQFVEFKEYLKWENESLQEFFDIFGSRIEKLSFVSRIENTPLEPYVLHRGLPDRLRNKHVQEEWVEGIKRLLLDHTRNLQDLSIQIPFRRKRTPQRSHSPESGLYFIGTDEGFREVKQECKKVLHEDQSLSLRVLRMGGTYCGVPLKLLETIIQLSPNLQEVLVDHHNYMPFVQPINRLELLKRLEIKFGNHYGLNAVEKVLDFVEAHDLGSNIRRFQLRHLKLFLNENDTDVGRNSSEYISAMNRLLAHTCDSLESFSWTVDGRVNMGEFQFPSAFPKVKEVVLRCVPCSTYIFGGPFLPSGVKFPEMFPNLRELVLLVTGRIGGVGAFIERLNFERQFQGHVTMGSVTRVRIEDRSRECYHQMSPESLAQFQGWFPNAAITYNIISEDPPPPKSQ